MNNSTPMIAGLPANLVALDLARAAARDSELDEAEQAERRAARDAEQAKIDAEYASSAYARTEPFRENDPPSADELGISTEGLTPARAALVRFAAWLKATRAELAALEGARDVFMSDIGAPGVTQSELDDMARADKSGFFAWLRGGADKAAKPTVDEYRRQQVQERLAEETYSAQIARDSLTALETEIAVQRKAVETLVARHHSFARKAVVEGAQTKLELYRQKSAELRGLMAELSALAQIGDRGGMIPAGSPGAIDIALPKLMDLSARIKIGAEEIKRHEGPWRTAIRALIADPHASIEPLKGDTDHADHQTS